MSIRRSMLFSLGGALPLDQVESSALFGFGLRKLRKAYSGYCLRVRNSVGAIGDLDFDSNDEVSLSSNVVITTGGTGFTVGSNYTLTQFANGGTVTVVTWYDQSPTARHITQAVVSNQLYLLESGAFRLFDNKPCLYSPTNHTGWLRYSGNCADYYNLVNNLGSLTIVKHSSSSVVFNTNQINLWGVYNFTTDSSSIPATNCTSDIGYYSFGVPCKSTTSFKPLGFSSRTSPNNSETCVDILGNSITYGPCSAHPIIGIGAQLSNVNVYDGTSKIISLADDNGNRVLTSYINSVARGTRTYSCSLVRFPMIDRANSIFQIGSNQNSALPNTGGATDIDYTFQEFIAFDGSAYHNERTTIENNMSVYYNINLG